MNDPRPRPEYGEYATPEQQAAAMGRVDIPPQHPEIRPSVAGAVPDRDATGTSLRPSGNLIDRFVTIFQLGIGLVFLLSSDFFHLGENSNIASTEFGLSQRVPVAVDQYAWLLLGANIVLLLATFFWAFSALRRGRLAFYIPIVGFLAFTVVLGITISATR